MTFKREAVYYFLNRIILHYTGHYPERGGHRSDAIECRFVIDKNDLHLDASDPRVINYM